ncbi:XRE family transcriptional regulator [Bartonella pachyuromydis]|uniref:HTH cro/C1-type domain-containing protein n=1 Tax=Bartonella pachyuromydis TaxID=931097 RepID=A0ABP8VQ40_9HYPH
MEREQLRLWLNEQLVKKGHGSKKMLAEHLGILPSTLTSILNNSGTNRSIKADELIKIINFIGEVPPFLIKGCGQFVSLFYQAKPEVQQAVLTILQNSGQSDKK